MISDNSLFKITKYCKKYCINFLKNSAIFPCIDWREQALAIYDNKMEKKNLFWINQYLILNTHPGVCCSEHPRLIDSFWDVAITYWHFSSFENLAWYWVLTFLFTIDIFVNVFHSIWNVCASKVAFLQRFFCSSTTWRQQVGFQLLILKKTKKEHYSWDYWINHLLFLRSDNIIRSIEQNGWLLNKSAILLWWFH